MMTWMMDGIERRERKECIPGQQGWFQQKHHIKEVQGRVELGYGANDMNT